MLNLEKSTVDTALFALVCAAQPGLDELTDSEVRLLRDMTLDQAHNATSPKGQNILGELWWQMERESQRRSAEVRLLDRLYFGS